MIDVSVSALTKEFEVGRKILDGLSFQVDSGERVGLLGKNGAGKTTIFRILTGALEYDSGAVAIASGKRVGLISQIPVFPPHFTVDNVLETAFAPLRALEAELADLTACMENDHDAALMRRYDAAHAAFELGGGYDTATELNKVTNGLGIPPAMRAQLFSALSGGEQTRVNLARLILENTDILLLDEPTNHLDMAACEWLEDYLKRYKGTVLVISHDRWFLDHVVSRIVELQDGKAEFYSGNYSFYVVEKQARYEEKLKQYEKEQAKIAQLQEAVDKLHLWAFMGADKLHKRAFSMEKRIERMRTTDRPRTARRMKAGFAERDFYGDELLIIRNLAKGYGGRTLFEDVNLELSGGERVALLGANGAGKTTLLRLLMGQEGADTGDVRTGPSVKMGYLPQVVQFEHPERNLIDTMLYECNCSTQQARDRLASFQFQGEDVFKRVSALSGGEQSRLRLCILMDEKINFLILDEPTNHLDIASREWIEGALEAYGGALLFVSHDRYFVDRFANRVWTVESGKVDDFDGSYEEYRAARARQAQEPKPSAPKKERVARGGGTKNLQKAITAVERAIDAAETKRAELDRAVEEFATDYEKLQELYEEIPAVEGELAALYAEWEELAEELSAQS